MLRLRELFRRTPSAPVLRDAAILLTAFGARAYEEARTRAREARLAEPSGTDARHWEKVRTEIARRLGRGQGVDTATRYLED